MRLILYSGASAQRSVLRLKQRSKALRFDSQSVHTRHIQPVSARRKLSLGRQNSDIENSGPEARKNLAKSERRCLRGQASLSVAPEERGNRRTARYWSKSSASSKTRVETSHPLMVYKINGLIMGEGDAFFAAYRGVLSVCDHCGRGRSRTTARENRCARCAAFGRSGRDIPKVGRTIGQPLGSGRRGRYPAWRPKVRLQQPRIDLHWNAGDVTAALRLERLEKPRPTRLASIHRLSRIYLLDDQQS